MITERPLQISVFEINQFLMIFNKAYKNFIHKVAEIMDNLVPLETIHMKDVSQSLSSNQIFGNISRRDKCFRIFKKFPQQDDTMLKEA